ncbi:MAG: EamA family transporter [Ilumatobacteraceae bacterium]
MFTIPRRQLATFAVLTSAVLFGTTGTVLVNAPAAADAYSVGSLRLLVGGATLLLVAARRRGRIWQSWTMRLTALGAVGVAVFQLCYFLAVERTGVAVGTVTTIGSGPVLSGLLHALVDRRSPGGAWTAGTSVSIVGVALLGLAGRSAAAEPAGILLAVCAGLGWAVFAMVGKRQIDAGVDSTAAMAAMFSGGALLLSPLLLLHSPGWVHQGKGPLVALYLGVVTVGAAYTLYGLALRHLPAPTVITLTLMEPITAAVLGAAVVHEAIRPAGWIGIGMVLIGLVVTARGARQEGDPLPM